LEAQTKRLGRRRDHYAGGVEERGMRGSPLPSLAVAHNICPFYVPALSWKSVSNILKHQTKVGGIASPQSQLGWHMALLPTASCASAPPIPASLPFHPPSLYCNQLTEYGLTCDENVYKLSSKSVKLETEDSPCQYSQSKHHSTV